MPDESAARRFDVRLLSRDFDCDPLRITRLDGHESIGQLFRFDIDVVSLDRAGLPSSAAGAEATLVLEQDGREVRRVHGIVLETTDAFVDRAGLRHHRLSLVPRAIRLAMVETQDIYMDVSVPELIAQKLRSVGLGRLTDMRLLAAYPKREFIVQYDETDLAFVSRLAEHLGISFFFEERDDQVRIVFTDHPDGFGSTRERPPIAFREWGEGHDVFEIAATSRMVPSFYVVRDYNEKTPHIDLTTFHQLDGAHPGGVCEFGPNVKTPDESERLARVRAEERRAGQLVYAGKSALPALAAGSRHHFEGHADIEPTDLLVTRVEHRARQAAAGHSPDAPLTYDNTFTAIPADRTYRPPRMTPRPRIPGLVTAIVDPGATGIERYAQLDAEGRYTLRFAFDTTPPGRRLASLPVRMLQAHAGEGSGMHLPLKPGTEVLVGFVNGDPDRPVLVGAVHNPLTPPVITNRTPMTHRLRTSGGVVIDLVDEP